jgi:hypothetical protein
MRTIWISPTGYVSGDNTLQIDYSSVTHPNTIIRCTKLGGAPKWISMGIPLSSGATITGVTICYQVSNARSSIAQVRLTEMTTPDTAIVRYDEATTLNSTAPVCHTGKPISFSPVAAVSLELRLEFANLADQIVLGGVGVSVTDSCDAEENRHVLSEFGPYDTVDKANATLQTALASITAGGGGVLCIPHDAPKDFYPRNKVEKGADQPAVTVIDFRNGIERIYAPPVGVTNSEVTAVAGRIVERDLAVNLPWQNVFSTEDIASRYLGGASSTTLRLTQPALKGSGRNFYVPTLRGLFAGQVLLVDPGSNQELLTIKQLGSDATGPFLVADSTLDHAAGVLIYNKNAVNGLTISDTSNCDNQSTSLAVFRTTYGTGDTFAIGALLNYQGNIMSALGDEGGVGVAANLQHDIDCFSGEVESWTLKRGADLVRELVYKPPAVAPQKLGTSRPIINMNPKKWVTSGKVNVIAPGFDFKREPAPSPSHEISTSFIIGDADVNWDQSIVGRFIAIDDPTEFYEKGEAAALGATSARVYRWWHITMLEKRASDGLWAVYIERTVFETNTATGPTLFLFDNYSVDDATYAKNKLAYIIAPGAWVSDARDGVAGNLPGNIGAASPSDERKLLLAPSSTEGAALDFEPGDAITNPPGPDVWIPTGFRTRHFHNFPAAIQGASFLSENFGKVQVGSGLTISGPVGSLAEVAKGTKDKATSYQFGVFILASTDSAIAIRGPVKTGALDFWQPGGNVQPLRWFVNDGASASTLFADPHTGNFLFGGGDVDLQSSGIVNASGLSGGRSPAHNLRGIGVDVPAGSTTVSVAFLKAEADANYAVLLECSWLTTKSVKNKTATGFDVEFSAGPDTGGGKLDWFLIR